MLSRVCKVPAAVAATVLRRRLNITKHQPASSCIKLVLIYVCLRPCWYAALSSAAPLMLHVPAGMASQ